MNRHKTDDSISSIEVDDGLVVLNESTGRYYYLNATAARIYEQLRRGADADSLTAEIAGTNTDGSVRTNTNRVKADVAALKDSLRQAGLL